MNKAETAILELKSMDALASLDSPLHKAPPLSKLLLTIGYILITVSFHKYDLNGLILMVLFPILGYQIAMVPMITCFQKLKIVMPLVCAVGILNPFFDRSPLLVIGTLSISGGVISMITLMMKGVFCLMASFLLVATTPIESICYAFRQIHFPRILTSLILLSFRFLTVLLEEVSIMTNAYHLRAPHQKGIHYSAWGSFLGQLILRSTDRAQALYESMLLRGYFGEFYYAGPKKASRKGLSILMTILILSLMLFCRFVAIASLLGSIFI